MDIVYGWKQVVGLGILIIVALCAVSVHQLAKLRDKPRRDALERAITVSVYNSLTNPFGDMAARVSVWLTILNTVKATHWKFMKGSSRDLCQSVLISLKMDRRGTASFESCEHELNLLNEAIQDELLRSNVPIDVDHQVVEFTDVIDYAVRSIQR